MTAVKQRILLCELCAEPISDPLELVYCSDACRRKAMLESHESSARRAGQSDDLPAGIVFRAYDGGLVVARVRGQSPGAFHIAHDDVERSVSRVEVLFELPAHEQVREARVLLTRYRESVAKAGEDLSRALAELAKPNP